MQQSSQIARVFRSALAGALLAAALCPVTVTAQGVHVAIKPRWNQRAARQRFLGERIRAARRAILAGKGRIRAGGQRAFAPSASPSLVSPLALGTRAIVSPPRVWKELGPNNAAFTHADLTFFGPGPVTGRINAAAYDPNNASIQYVAAAVGGIWKTTNNGVSWRNLLGNNLTDKLPTTTLNSQAFSGIMVDPNNSNIIYAASGDYDGMDGAGSGLLKSVDGGNSWTALGKTEFGALPVRKVLVDPGNSNNLLVASASGLFRSTDGGATLTLVLDSLLVSNVVYNADHSVVYASVDAEGIYRSTDNGVTWDYLTQTDPKLGPAPDPVLQPESSLRIDVAASPTDPNVVYYLSDGQASCYKSVDGGTNFQSITGFILGDPANFGQGNYDFYLSASTNPATGSDVLYVGLYTIFQSPDGGDSWQDIALAYSSAAKIHTDQHGLTINPHNPNEALVSNDGGVYRMTFRPTARPERAFTFANLNQNINIAACYGIALHPNNLNYVMSGTQDTATPYSRGNLNNWINVGYGDGGQCAINPKNPANSYNTAEELSVFMTDDDYATEAVDITPDTGGEPVLFIAPIALDTLTPKFLYGGAKSLYLYNHDEPDATKRWTKLGQAFSSATTYEVSAIAVAPGDSKTVYVGTTDGHLWWGVRKDLTGTDFTWTEITTSLPGGGVSNISVSSANANRIYVCMGGQIYRCANTAAVDSQNKSLASWFQVSNNLPEVNTMAIGQRADERILYAATTNGVFQTTDAGANWSEIGYAAKLPTGLNVPDLKYMSSTGNLVAGTYGRGMWSLKVADDVNFSLYPYLQNYRGQKSNLKVTVTISAPGSVVGETHTGYLTPAGELKITAFTSGVYDIYIQVPGFLNRRLRSANIQPGARLSAQLINGDVTGDNVLDAADLSVITRNLGRRVTGAGSGDVDGDGIVTKNDYDIVQGNINRGNSFGDQ